MAERDWAKGREFLRFAFMSRTGLLVLAVTLVVVAVSPSALKVVPVMGGTVVLLRLWQRH
jgi:hypothetical protein